MGVVVDASFIASALLPEEHSPFVEATLTGMDERALLAPALLSWEIGNILRKNCRRGDLSPDQAEERLAAFCAMDISQYPPTPEALARTARLATAHDLTVYDASYLDLALSTGFGLASLDRPLVVVARKLGLSVYSPFA